MNPSRHPRSPEVVRLEPAGGYALTVDVEEWYHNCLVPSYVNPERRPHLPVELDRLIPKLLGLLAAAGRTATFFVLGEVAERLPARVREIARAGHEVASHGYLHLRACARTREDFGRDIRRSKALLEDLLGEPVRGFRAPEWSLRTLRSPLLECLLEAGFVYDSSLAPYPLSGRLSNPLYASRLRWPAAGGASAATPGEVALSSAACATAAICAIPSTNPVLVGEGSAASELLEFPPLTFGGFLRVPAGSWTGRLVRPERLLRAADRHFQRGGLPVAVVHPWEISGEPTPGPLSGAARFIHETGRTGFTPRFEELLAALPWRSVRDAAGLAVPSLGGASAQLLRGLREAAAPALAQRLPQPSAAYDPI